MNDQVVDRISLERVLSNTRDGIFVLDPQQRFVYFNSVCEQITGYAADELLGCPESCGEIARCHDQEGRPLTGSLCPARAILQGHQTSTRQLMRIATKSGGQRWVETQYTPIRREDGETAYVIGVMRDATDAHEREEQWHQSMDTLREEVDRLRQQLSQNYGFDTIVTRSPAMQIVLDRVRAASGNSSPALIAGEPGTGKETVARTIHFNGLQKGGPFIVMCVPATPKELIEAELFGTLRPSSGIEHRGLIQAADGGTLYIDGVDKLPEPTQVRLLKAIQDRAVRPSGAAEPIPVNIRVIASTSRSLNDILASGSLREDLFSRLSVIAVELPPLRDRKEDIPLLIEQFLSQLNRQSTRQVKQVDPAVWKALDSHDWPGNAQELHNVIEAGFACGAGDTLRIEEINLSGTAQSARGESGTHIPPLDELLSDFERQAILTALRRARGQRSLAARLLGISRSRLYRRMDALGIAPRTAED